MTAREEYEEQRLPVREGYVTMCWQDAADAALAEADEDRKWLQDANLGLQAKLKQAEERIEKLNAGHAAQVEAIVQTRDHVEKKLAQAEAEVERLNSRFCKTCAYFPDCAYRYAFDEYWNNGPPVRDTWGCICWAERGGEE